MMRMASGAKQIDQDRVVPRLKEADLEPAGMASEALAVNVQAVEAEDDRPNS